MTCPHADPCASPYVHAERDCRCSCGKLLRTHPPLDAHKLKTWRDQTNEATRHLGRPPAPTIRPMTIHRVRDAGDGTCAACRRPIHVVRNGHYQHTHRKAA